MKSLRIIVDLELSNTVGQVLNESQLRDIGDMVEEAIIEHLFGGRPFFPAEVVVDRRSFKTEIVS